MLSNYERRKFRVRNGVIKNNKSGRPRIVVNRSNKNISVQLIDLSGKVLKAFSTLSFEENKKATGIEKAKMVGKEFAKVCIASGVKEVVFDKGAYIYNGRVKAVADACREGGLQF
jgi:large subunit ribosomal protein L18